MPFKDLRCMTINFNPQELSRIAAPGISSTDASVRSPAVCKTAFCSTCGLYHEGQEIPKYDAPLHVHSASLWTAMQFNSSRESAGTNAASAASALPTSTAFTTRSWKRVRTLWTKRAHGCGFRTGSSFYSRSRLARRLVASSAFKFVPVHLG
jgi:transcription elongation factor Elf1